MTLKPEDLITLIEALHGYRVSPESAARIGSENAAVRQALESCARSLTAIQPADLETVFENAAPAQDRA